MSYIRSKDTYAYPDGEGGLVLHTNHVTDQDAANIGSRQPCNHHYRYLVQLPMEELTAKAGLAKSGTFTTYLSCLRTARLIETGRGMAQANRETLFL
jgi:hypothetical protein